MAIWNRSLPASEIKDLYRARTGRYFWKVNVTDGTYQNETAFRNFNMLGNQPSLSNAVLNVSNVTLTATSDTIQANVTADDFDGDKLNATLTFYVNDAANITVQLLNSYANGTAITYSLNNTNITFGQNIIVQFNASDGGLASNYLNTSRITSNNTAPNLTSASLNVTNATLTASADWINASVSLSDSDAEKANLTAVFYVNNAANITVQILNNYQSGSTVSYVFNNTNVTGGQNIIVQFNASDGGLASNYLNTSRITVNNSVPYAAFNKPVQDENFSVDNFNITLNATVYDIDREGITTRVYAYGSKQLEVQADANTVLVMHFNNDSSVGENDSRIYDFTGLGNNGTLGLPNNATWNASGKIGGSYSFDGIDDSVDVGSGLSLNITNAITVSAWIYPRSSHNGGVIEKTIGGAVNKQYLLYLSPTPAENLTFRVMKSTLTYNAVSASYPALNQWTHVVGRYDGSELSLWVNGIKQVITATVTAPIDSGLGVTLIGLLGSNVYPFNGSIDEVAIWNRSLSANEIQTIYNKQKYGYYSSLVLKNQTAQNGTPIAYNITAVPIAPDNTTVALFHFDNESWIGENDTRFYDWTGTGNNGSCDMANNRCPRFNASGKIGGAYSFDGIDDNITADVPDYQGNFTVVLWAKAATTGQGEYSAIFASDKSGGSSNTFQIDVGGAAYGCSGQYRIRGEQANGSAIPPLCINTVTTNWTFLAVTFNSTNLSAYADGIAKGSLASPLILFNGGFKPFLLGIKKGQKILL